MAKAEQLIRNLARRLEREAPGVSEMILEGIDKILTVMRLRLSPRLGHSLACASIIENMMGTIRRVCRNMNHGRDAAMAPRWTGAAMQGRAAKRIDAKGIRRLKAHKPPPRRAWSDDRRRLSFNRERHVPDDALDPRRS